MFVRVVVAACLCIGAALVWGSGRSWLPAPRWSLIGAAIADTAYLSMIPEYAQRHSYLWVLWFSSSILIFTIDAIRKYNKLRQTPA